MLLHHDFLSSKIEIVWCHPLGLLGRPGAIVTFFSHTCSLRRACILLTIYLSLIPQLHMLSKRMTACRVLIVTYVDAIKKFMQPGNCYK